MNMIHLSFVLALLSQLEFTQRVQIDTSVQMLHNTPFYDEATALRAHQRLEKRVSQDIFLWDRDYYLYFRYHDEKFIPVWHKLLKEKPENDLLKIWYINAIIQIGKPEHLELIAPFRQSDNSLIRECAANAYGFLGSEDSVGVLEKWLSSENDGYVASTLIASIKAIESGRYQSVTDYLPQYYEESPRKLKFFYNINVESSLSYRFHSEDTSSGTVPISSRFIFPFQQYEHKIKYAPDAGTFANKHGEIYHCGEDMGWFMEGLPVHSISNGRVRSVSHDLSWGCLVVVETVLPPSDTLCVIYGHLSRFIDVVTGDEVRMGQKIGQIGNSVSYENGGYWAHLHLGIEKSSFRNALLGGYTYGIERYMEPSEIIRGNYPKCSDKVGKTQSGP